MAKLNLYRPVKARVWESYPWKNSYSKNNQWGGSVVSQFFGENQLPIYATLGLKGHNGLDISTAFREPVYAAHDGKVLDVSKERERGIGCTVVTENSYDYEPSQYHFKTVYWHFDELVVEPGQWVEVGNLLGYSDSTGISTGHHLHFELKPIRKENGIFVNVEQNNGFFGAVDPMIYMTEMDAEDRRKQLDSIEYQIKIIAEKIKELLGLR